MNKDDLKVLAEVGRALWVDPHESQIATIETLSAVTLLDLTPERALERAAKALLERVTSRGLAANTRSNLNAGALLGMGQPFFRLLPEERFFLVALHLGRWSYARLSRISGETPEQIEELAWGARLQLAASEQVMIYPAGASVRGTNCPEYNSKRPWTQRFLDEEMSTGRERVFLQNHLMACDSCRGALTRCREVYYSIDRLLPRLNEDSGDVQMIRNLEKISRSGLGIRKPMERTFLEGLAIFGSRRDIQLVLAAFGLLLIWSRFK
jgi:hypothetical protein